MVHVVTTQTKRALEGKIADMHRDRKRVFVDWLKWKVPVIDGQYEIDQFDGEHAVYLIESDRATGKHLASLRLLPSLKPHLLQDVFPQLCDTAVPTGEDVMELTRFCVSPDVDKDTALVLMNRMWTAAVEYALLYGIERYSCISHQHFLAVMLAGGWGAELLGQIHEIDGQRIGAIVFTISQATLRECRRRFGYRAPVLELIGVADAA